MTCQVLFAVFHRIFVAEGAVRHHVLLDGIGLFAQVTPRTEECKAENVV